MRLTRTLAAVASLAAAMALTSCGSDSGNDSGDDSAGTEAGSSAASADAFPVTIKHAFGETTIESKPERVATIAWDNNEVPLALGVVPVGMAKATWGDDDGDGVLPWVEDQLNELGAETPVLFDETEGIDFEAVADTAPDVILASYSGITEKDYETLSKIAPTIAYPKLAWGTQLDEMVTMNSEAIGLADEGQQLVDDLDTDTAAVAEDHPDLAGKSAIFAYIDPTDLSKIGFYTTHDPRAAFFADLGLSTPKVVTDATAKTDEFYQEVSSEDTESFSDVDVIVTYGDAKTLAALQKDPLLGKIPAIKNGAVALLTDSTPLAASANPTPLSIPWGLGDYATLIDDAAKKSS